MIWPLVRQDISGDRGGLAEHSLSYAMPATYWTVLDCPRYAALPQRDPAEPPCTDPVNTDGVTGKASHRISMSIP